MATGGPKIAMMCSLRNVAMVLAFLSGIACKRTNFEKVSTASKTWFIYVHEDGKSTRRSSAQVWRGPGGSGSSELHLGWVRRLSFNWQAKHCFTYLTQSVVRVGQV